MDPVLMRPKKAVGSRTFDGTGQRFSITRRTLGTSDLALCMFIYADVLDTRGLFRTADTTKGINIRLGSGGGLTVHYGDGSTLQAVTAANGTISAATWHYLVVNVARGGNLDIYVDDMTTPKQTADISGAAAVDYVSGNSTWSLSAYIDATYNYWNGRIARFGFIIGSTLSEAERTALRNSGYGLRYSQFTAGLITKFTSQDWHDMRRPRGDEPNQATAARPLVQSSSPGSAKGPR